MDQKGLIEVGLMLFMCLAALSIPLFFLWKWESPKHNKK